MNRLGKVSFYGTLAILCLSIVIGILALGGVTVLLYLLVGGLFFVASIWAIGKFVPKFWQWVIFVAIFTTIFYFLFDSWIYLLIIMILLGLTILMEYKMTSHKWLRFVVTGIIIVLIPLFQMDVFKPPPEIKKHDMDIAIEQVEEHEQIKHAHFELIDKETISCSLIVVPNLSESDQENVGEMCVKSLADRMSENTRLKAPKDDYLGELYDYYDVRVMVGGDRGLDDIIVGSKHKHSDHLTW